MSNKIRIQVKCPACGASLMNEDHKIDDLASIRLQAKIGPKIGFVYLSQVYGSYSKEFEDIDDNNGLIADFSCPNCDQAFPVETLCECKAPMIGIQLQVGGMIKFCSRNGCQRHSLEFEDIDDAFLLFRSQDESRLG